MPTQLAPIRAIDEPLRRPADVTAIFERQRFSTPHASEWRALLMAVTYDETIIRAFVERLYRKANNVIATYTLLGVGIGLSAGYILAGFLGEVDRGRMPYEALCILLFGGIAFSAGRDRSFALRVRAQLALCQLRIEENTRPTPVSPE